MKAKNLISLLGFLLGLSGSSSAHQAWSHEVVYQIFERSFFDSNGDRIGDFKGIEEKLPYIASLGATSILLQPILKSPFYHNYFADDFFAADPSLGGTAQFFDLVRAAHRRKIKVILDFEPQYVASGHPWFKAGPPRTIPHSGIYGIEEVPIYSGARIGVTTVNLMNPANAAEIEKAMKFWAVPEGGPADGVDGFRIDHMMDDLDNMHVNVNLLAGFWAPIEQDLRRAKPSLFFVAEQSDWESLGGPQFGAGEVDAVYAIPLRFAFIGAVVKGTVRTLADALNQEQSVTPAGKTQLIVVEDHDVMRWASAIHRDPALLRLAAVFQMTVRGTPSVYYGQELGMLGRQLQGKTDGNDIPIRRAMPWNSSLSAPGTATWYGKGPWTEESESSGGISVEEEKRDPTSLLNFYRRLIRLRNRNPALTEGDQSILPTDSPSVLAILRRTRGEAVVAIMNFAAKGVKFQLKLPLSGPARDLMTGSHLSTANANIFSLSSHGCEILQVHLQKANLIDAAK
jgi:alpha-amylase